MALSAVFTVRRRAAAQDRRVRLAAALVLVAACVARTDVVTVTLRDPARVAVVATDGTAVLPVGVDEATISPDAFVHDPLRDAFVARGADRSLVVVCPRCRGDERDRLVSADAPDLVLHDGPAAVRFADGALHARYTFADLVPGRHGPWRDPRIRLELVTPAANVAAIRVERRVVYRHERGVGRVLFPVGLAVAGAGAAMVGDGIRAHEPALEPIAVMAVVAGAAIAVAGWVSWHATDQAWQLPVR
jgi:hypothetical protein